MDGHSRRGLLEKFPLTCRWRRDDSGRWYKRRRGCRSTLLRDGLWRESTTWETVVASQTIGRHCILFVGASIDDTTYHPPSPCAPGAYTDHIARTHAGGCLPVDEG